MNTEMYLRRRSKVIVANQSDHAELDDAYLVSMQKNIESLGYTFSTDVLKALKQTSQTQAISFYEDVVAALKQLVGANVVYKPMYPNFPKQVANADEVELYINAQLHYFGNWLGVRILPEYEKEARGELTDNVSLKTINLGSVDDFNSIFTLLVQSKSSVSESNKNDIKWFAQNYTDNIVGLLPDEIPNKENLATVTCYLLEYTQHGGELAKQYFKTATDVLRLIVALSGGDVSLAEKSKIKSFKRAERRMILELLENCKSITEDMLRYKEQWKRAGERLHPSEYKSRFPKTEKAFEVLRDDKPFETFNSKLEQRIKQHDNTTESLALLKTRPGELARKLDLLLRTASNPQEVLDAFSEVAPSVSSTVLWQLWAHLKERNHQKPIRVFFPKGNVGKAQAIENNLPKLNEETRQKAIAICRDALLAKYKTLPPLGKVYIDRELKDFTIPFALRSASKALRTVGRGSRLALPSGNTVRFFIWWKDGIDRTDIDLSALALDEHSQFKMQIAYYNLKELGGYHSGDITSAPDGASEFIDLEIDKMLEAGVRYVIMSVNSYTEQPFYDLPECFAGFMMRQHPQSGEIYEPRTVGNKIDLTANTRVCLPFIIDLKKRSVIWTDLAVTRNPSSQNNVLGNMSTLTIMNKAMLSLVKPSLLDLFTFHAEARGELVKTIDDADIVFSLKQGITPFDTDTIVGEYL
jgi:stress response protein SCP2